MLFIKYLIANASVEVINFQYPIHKSVFHIYYARAVFHLPEKLVAKQYLEVLRTSASPQILIPQKKNSEEVEE